MFVRFKLVWLNDMHTAGVIPLIEVPVTHANELSAGAVVMDPGFVPVLAIVMYPVGPAVPDDKSYLRRDWITLDASVYCT